MACVPYSVLPSLSRSVTPESCTRVLVRAIPSRFSMCLPRSACMFSYRPALSSWDVSVPVLRMARTELFIGRFPQNSSPLMSAIAHCSWTLSRVWLLGMNSIMSTRLGKLNTKSWFGAHCASLLQLVCHCHLKSSRDDRPGTCGRCCAVLVH